MFVLTCQHANICENRSFFFFFYIIQVFRHCYFYYLHLCFFYSDEKMSDNERKPNCTMDKSDS